MTRSSSEEGEDAFVQDSRLRDSSDPTLPSVACSTGEGRNGLEELQAQTPADAQSNKRKARTLSPPSHLNTKRHRPGLKVDPVDSALVSPIDDLVEPEPEPEPETEPDAAASEVSSLDTAYTELYGSDPFDISVATKYTGHWGRGWGNPKFVNPVMAKIKEHIAQMEQDHHHRFENQASKALKEARFHLQWLEKSIIIENYRQKQSPSPFLRFIPSDLNSKVFYEIRPKRVQQELDKQKEENGWADGQESRDWQLLQKFKWWLDWGAKLTGALSDKPMNLPDRVAKERKKRVEEEQPQIEEDKGEAFLHGLGLKGTKKKKPYLKD